MRLPIASPTACSAVLLIAALAGCGGSGEKAARQPRIEPAAAQQLASLSDAVGELAGQDECAAAHRADELYVAAKDAAAQGRVSAELRQELIARATELRDELNCEPPPPPPPEKDDGHDNAKRDKKGKKGGQGGDEG
jgi:hypothetical protein